MKRLLHIQQTLNAPKNLYNSFGEFYFRSCETILEAVKPLLGESGLVLIITDTPIEVNGKTYIEAKVTLKDAETGAVLESTTASAREAEERIKMDAAQLTGTASSYARKYALNGLFCIDDSKDPDTDEYKKQKDTVKGRAKEELPTVSAPKPKNLSGSIKKPKISF